jgi:hypothetical protein
MSTGCCQHGPGGHNNDTKRSWRSFIVLTLLSFSHFVFHTLFFTGEFVAVVGYDSQEADTPANDDLDHPHLAMMIVLDHDHPPRLFFVATTKTMTISSSSSDQNWGRRRRSDDDVHDVEDDFRRGIATEPD